MPKAIPWFKGWLGRKGVSWKLQNHKLFVISMGVAIYTCVKIKEKISWVASTMPKMQMKILKILKRLWKKFDWSET
jgi:hypothetical protein